MKDGAGKCWLKVWSQAQGAQAWAGSGFLAWFPASVQAGCSPSLSFRLLTWKWAERPLPGSGVDRNRGGDHENPVQAGPRVMDVRGIQVQSEMVHGGTWPGSQEPRF